MNKVVFLESERKLQEQAGVWIAKMDRGLSDGERTELQQWLAQSLRHRNALFEIAKTWDQMDMLGEIGGLFPLERRTQPGLAWRIAAALALVAVISGFTVHAVDWSRAAASIAGFFTDQSPGATYRTAIGEQKTIQLPDRSVITLNTDTLLRVNYTATDRKLELVRGEAHFKVAKDSYRVFAVKVGENEFRAVGTAFNIRTTSAHGIELTVTEGRVKVVVPLAKEAIRSVSGERDKVVPTEIVVDANKEVIIDRATQTIEPLPPTKVEAALAWQRGMLIFDGDPLEQVVQELSRYATTKFVIADDSIRQIPVTGYFKIGDIDGLVAALHANFDINVDRKGESILLSAK